MQYSNSPFAPSQADRQYIPAEYVQLLRELSAQKNRSYTADELEQMVAARTTAASQPAYIQHHGHSQSAQCDRAR